MKIVKSAFRGKRGRTYQGAIMDAWINKRDLMHKVESEETNSANHQF